MHGPFAARSQIGVIQYAFVMPVLTIVRFIAQYLNIYKDGTVKIRVVYPYVAAVRNVSQFVALYCIVLYFYVRVGPWKHTPSSAGLAAVPRPPPLAPPFLQRPALLLLSCGTSHRDLLASLLSFTGVRKTFGSLSLSA